MFDSNTLSTFPKEIGVYLMKDEKKRVVYVGKAKNLQDRIKQYFFARDTRPMIPFLVAEVDTIDTILVPTEKEALILENTLIKKHKPKYNILLKDDKTFVSLMLTAHEWPMIRLIRYKKKPPKDKNLYFGPYTNAHAARQTLDLIIRLFSLRQCSDAEFANRTRPCLLYDIKKCLGPCVGRCTKEDYLYHVNCAIKILKGQDKQILKELKNKMKEASDALLFEKANSFLQMIRQIEHVTEIQHVDNPSAKDSDVLGFYREHHSVIISKLIFKEGKLVGSEHFSFYQIASEDFEILESFILQHYPLQEKISPTIYLPLPLPNQKNISEILQEGGKKITLFTPKKGNKHSLVEMAMHNAKAQFLREQDLRSVQEKLLLAIQEELHLTRFPKIIECFDTSHIAGTDPVASMVGFTNGKRDKKLTRYFKIKTEEKGDPAALEHVLFRHFKKEKEEDHYCDLLIVDGGKAQLNVALKVLESLNIATIDVIGVSKQKSLHTKGMTEEKVYLPHVKDPIVIDPRSPLLFLLQKVRDEAHRSAIEFHRNRRSKRALTSVFDQIRGIGPVKKRVLLQHFKSYANLEKASLKDIQNIKELSKKDLEILLEHLKKN